MFDRARMEIGGKLRKEDAGLGKRVAELEKRLDACEAVIEALARPSIKSPADGEIEDSFSGSAIDRALNHD